MVPFATIKLRVNFVLQKKVKTQVKKKIQCLPEECSTTNKKNNKNTKTNQPAEITPKGTSFDLKAEAGLNLHSV